MPWGTCRCRPYIRRDDSPAIANATRQSLRGSADRLRRRPPDCTSRTELLDALAANGIERAEITLHVGYGTFKPITADRVEEHVVDPERYEISVAAAAAIEPGAIGWPACHRCRYDNHEGTGRCCEAGRRHCATLELGRPTIFIYPGFVFQVVNGLLTNFHLPKSSLLMLVCAFAGSDAVLRGLPNCRRASLPVLQLRGCDAGGLTLGCSAAGSFGFCRVARLGNRQQRAASRDFATEPRSRDSRAAGSEI